MSSHTLRAGGIPLEYRTASLMARAGLSVVQGMGYPAQDSTGDKIREIDVLGVLQTDNDADLIVSLVAECKHTTNPWIVLTNDDVLSPKRTIMSAVADDLARMSLRRTLDSSRGRRLPGFLNATEKPGFSVVSMGERDDRPTARNAMAQVVGAATGIRKEVKAWTVCWPVVVIDGPLVKLAYHNGAEVLDEVGWHRIEWHASPYRAAAVVDVVGVDAFEEYVGQATVALRWAAKWMAADRSEYESAANADDYGLPKALE